jgi:hypothetical protein
VSVQEIIIEKIRHLMELDFDTFKVLHGLGDVKEMKEDRRS